MKLPTKKPAKLPWASMPPPEPHWTAYGNIHVARPFGNGVARISKGKAVTVLPGAMTTDVAISGNRLATSTNALMPSGKLVTARIR